MKQKLIVAALIGCIAVAGCKSRFTSTSDSSGPRKYENADPSFQPSGNPGNATHLPTEKLDSGHVMNTQTDSMHLSADTTQLNAH